MYFMFTFAAWFSVALIQLVSYVEFCIDLFEAIAVRRRRFIFLASCFSDAIIIPSALCIVAIRKLF